MKTFSRQRPPGCYVTPMTLHDVGLRKTNSMRWFQNIPWGFSCTKWGLEICVTDPLSWLQRTPLVAKFFYITHLAVHTVQYFRFLCAIPLIFTYCLGTNRRVRNSIFSHSTPTIQLYSILRTHARSFILNLTSARLRSSALILLL